MIRRIRKWYLQGERFADGRGKGGKNREEIERK